jgi:hypothetical protein
MKISVGYELLGGGGCTWSDVVILCFLPNKAKQLNIQTDRELQH